MSLMKRLIDWATVSVFGCIVFCGGICFALPASVYFVARSLSDGTFTVAHALFTVAVALAMGALAATLIWHTVLQPIRARLPRSRDDG